MTSRFRHLSMIQWCRRTIQVAEVLASVARSEAIRQHDPVQRSSLTAFMWSGTPLHYVITANARRRRALAGRFAEIEVRREGEHEQRLGAPRRQPRRRNLAG